MSEKIVIEMEGKDNQLKSMLASLNKQLEGISDSANYTSSLENNLSAFDRNIQKAEQLRQAMIALNKEATTLADGGISAGGTKASRARQQQALDSLIMTSNVASGVSQRGINTGVGTTASRILGGTPSFYHGRLNEPETFARQREDARTQLRNMRNEYNDLTRDGGTANRSVIQSNRRIQTRIQSGGFISSGERITANNNLNSARDILTDNGRFSSTDGRINDLKYKKDINNSLRDSLYGDIKRVTNNGKNRELTTAEKNTIQELTHQRDLLKTQNDSIDKYTKRLNSIKQNYDKLEQSLNSPDAKYAPSGGLNGMIYNRSQKIANGIVYGGAASALGLGMVGNGIIEQNQPITRAMGANNGTYNSRASQLAAQRAGMKYGLSGSDMLSSEAAYMSGAGYTNARDMAQAGLNTGMFAKTSGMTIDQSNALTSVVANSGGDAKSLKGVQDTFYGALKQAGLTSRANGQATQLSSILGTYAGLRGGQVTSDGINGQVAMQSALGSTGNSGLLGQNGANFMNQMNSSIIGQGADSQLMQLALRNRDPQKYSGSFQGYANIINQTQKGLDGTNLSSLSNYITDITGGPGYTSSTYMANALNKNFGTNITTDTAQSIQKLAGSGKLDGLDTKGAIKAMQQSGAITADEAKKMQQKSSDATYDKGNAAFEKAAATVGNLTRELTSMMKVTTGGSATITLLGGAALGAAGALAKIGLSTGLSNAIRGGVTGGGTGGGFFSTMKAGGTNLLSKAKNSPLGSKILSSAPAVMAKNGIAKGSGLLAKGAEIATSFIGGSNALSAGAGFMGKATNVLGKAVPFLPAVLSAGQIAGDFMGGASSKQKATDIGGGIGTVVGGIAGTFLGGGPWGTAIGATAGNWLGSNVGGMFGSEASQKKDDESLTNKKLQTEQQRAKNIKEDGKFVNEYGRVIDKKGNSNLFNSSGSDVSSDSSTSPFENLKNTGSYGAAGATNGGQTQVVISGTINHTGSVADMSQVEVSAQGVLSNLFNGVTQANETRRV